MKYGNAWWDLTAYHIMEKLCEKFNDEEMDKLLHSKDVIRNLYDMIRKHYGDM